MAPRQVVRGYELQEPVGAGGFGEVYRAYQPSVGRQVAIKIILPQHATHPEFIRRFEVEARLIARLEHPHIVPLYDYWRETDTGDAYLVMRWLPGGNLYQSLQRGPWALEDAARLLDQVAGALDGAHRQDVIHRDVKPENILLDLDGNAYLSDFGIAKDLQRTTSMTAPDAIPGSLLYIAPEAVQGQAVTPQSDQYSLGIVMHELLTGVHPYSDSTPATLLVRVLSDPLPPLRAKRPDLPAALEDVLQRATAKQPVERYPDVLAFAQAFRKAVFRKVASFEALLGTPGPAAAEVPVQPPAFLVTEAEGELVKQPVFVARDQELTRLNGFLDAALSGRGQVVFVTGGPGRGKTTLLNEFARRAIDAHPDLLVASGTCNAFSGVGDPYLPFCELMEMLTGKVESLWRAGTITRDHAVRLWDALPDTVRALLDHGPHVTPTLVRGEELLSRCAAAARQDTLWLQRLRERVERQQTRSEGVEQSHLFQQLTNTLRELSQTHPLLLILDDLQWADTASISLFFHLGRRLEHSPILIACAFRPEEIALGREGERHPLEPVVAELKRVYGDLGLDLAKEAMREGRGFVDAYLDAEPNRLQEAFRASLFHHTSGHPLFTVELLRAMQARGDLVQDEQGCWMEGPALDWEALPPRVEAVIEERINRLEEELREMLSIASVEGESFTAQVVARVQRISERQTLRRLSRELEKRHRLVREGEVLTAGPLRLSRYQFAHALFQRYLYHGLGEGERALLHREIADVLEALHGKGPEQTGAIAAQLAHHYARAGDPQKERQYAQLAGERAAARYANSEALRYLDRALELAPEVDHSSRFGLLQTRERVYSLVGEREAQANDLTAMTELAQALADPERQAQVALRQSSYCNVTGDYGLADAAAQHAVRLAQEAGDIGLEAAARRRWGRALESQGHLEQARSQYESAVRLAQSASLPRVEAESRRGLGVIADFQGDFAAAAEHHRQSLCLFREIGSRSGESTTLNDLGILAARQNDCAAATSYFDESLRIYREIGARPGEASALNNLAAVAQLSGDFAGTRTYFEQSLHIKREIGSRSGESTTLVNLGIVSRSVGDYAGAKAHLDQALQISREIGSPLQECASLSGLSLLSHQLGENQAAQDYAQAALHVAQEMGEPSRQAEAWCNLGHAQRGLGLLTEAAESYAQSLALRRELAQSSPAMQALAGLAQIALERDDHVSAATSVEEVLSHLRAHKDSGGAGHAFDGTDEPLRIYLTCYRVLTATQDPRAAEVLENAHDLLQEQAAKITDSELCRSFLENVPAHRELVNEWQAVDRDRG